MSGGFQFLTPSEKKNEMKDEFEDYKKFKKELEGNKNG